MASGYNWQDLRPFVVSLRQTTFDGEVCFIGSQVSEATRGKLRLEGIEVQSAPRWRFPLHPYSRRLTRLWPVYPPVLRHISRLWRDPRKAEAHLAALVLLPEVARHLRYYEYLVGRRAEFDAVLLADTRDVVFQRDPFDFELGAQLNCFLEDTRFTLGSEPVNAGWMRSAFGEDGLKRVADCPISCAGVTIGPPDAVLSYLKTMVEWLTRVLPNPWHGSDQAVHNYVIHTNVVRDVRLVSNYQGPVLTMGLMPQDITADALVGPDGLPINIVHQYDRHPSIEKLLLERFDAVRQS
jgi:hypothetical protein